MADVFIEHMIRRKTTLKTLVFKLLIVIAASLLAILPIVILVLTEYNLSMLVPVAAVASLWGGMLLVRRLDVEFEYIVTNGEVDVDKIIAKNARKRVLSVDCRNFEVLAPLKEQFLKEFQDIARKIDTSSCPNSQNSWFAVFNSKDGIRTMLIFEPDSRMLRAFAGYIPSRKIKCADSILRGE